MIEAEGLTLEINGRAATAGELRALALGGYGHFTAMQLRGGRTRGLQLHLDRLDAANREMFGAALAGGQVRDLIRHALGARVRDASVRVIVQQPVEQEPPWVMVTIRPPADPLPDSSLQQVAYQRSLAHLKHTGDFGQSYYGRLAERNGFGEALLTGPDGLISEGSVTNIGFFDGTAVVSPAPRCFRASRCSSCRPGSCCLSGTVRCGSLTSAHSGRFSSRTRTAWPR